MGKKEGELEKRDRDLGIYILKKREGETKHTGRGSRGSKALLFSTPMGVFPLGGGENNSRHESVPNDSTTTSPNK